eukprot:GHVU01163400.1.p1 GENE.GHVU01163400.1~~GHVU01163400.1.p1  ORF type:complete len:104 (+),score=0.40 GHVU01163400.1:357-668(+)
MKLMKSHWLLFLGSSTAHPPYPLLLALSRPIEAVGAKSSAQLVVVRANRSSFRPAGESRRSDTWSQPASHGKTVLKPRVPMWLYCRNSSIDEQYVSVYIYIYR